MALDQPSLAVLGQYFFLNIISAFLCSAAHNALYFMLGLSMWAFHFLHYFFTFAAILVGCGCGFLTKRTIPIREVIPIVATQVVVSAATALVHYSGRDGALFTIRLSDGPTILFVMFFGYRFVEERFMPRRENRLLMIVLAVATSLAWMEFGLLDDSWLSICMVPIIAVAQAAHFLLVFQKQQSLGVSPDQLMLYHTGLTALVLFPFAVYFTSDSFNEDITGGMGSWELIDWGLVLMSVGFFACLIYSKYFLIGYTSPETWLVLRSGKYLIGSIGNWFTIDIEHANFLSVGGKIAIAVCFALYFLRKRRDLARYPVSAS